MALWNKNLLLASSYRFLRPLINLRRSGVWGMTKQVLQLTSKLWGISDDTQPVTSYFKPLIGRKRHARIPLGGRCTELSRGQRGWMVRHLLKNTCDTYALDLHTRTLNDKPTRTVQSPPQLSRKIKHKMLRQQGRKGMYFQGPFLCQWVNHDATWSSGVVKHVHSRKNNGELEGSSARRPSAKALSRSIHRW